MKDEEMDENMAKIMKQMKLLTKHVMRGCSKSVNGFALSGSQIYEVDKFETLYNEEVQFLSNQVGVSRPTFYKQD